MAIRQSGAAAVEFALIAIVFFFIWLGIMELGRIMYIWNTVQEVTRHAARDAVVRDFTTDVSAIKREAIFRPGSIGTVYLPAGIEVSNLRVQIAYLNSSLNEIDLSASTAPTDPADNIAACGDANRNGTNNASQNYCIRYVKAQLCQASGASCSAVDTVPYAPMVILFANLGIDLAVKIPVSAVVMPAESLGFSVSG